MKEESASGLEVRTSHRILVAELGTSSTETHGSGASASFRFSIAEASMTFSAARPEGSLRLELFVGNNFF